MPGAGGRDGPGIGGAPDAAEWTHSGRQRVEARPPAGGLSSSRTGQTATVGAPNVGREHEVGENLQDDTDPGWWPPRTCAGSSPPRDGGVNTRPASGPGDAAGQVPRIEGGYS